MMDELCYKNLIAAFFVEKKMIVQHKQRIEKCMQFVANKLPPLSVRAREAIMKSIKSVEITFLKRWHETKCVDLVRFEQDNEKWIHTNLKASICIFCRNCP